MVLSTIGMLLAAGTINKAAKNRGKKANSKLNNVEFDAHNAEYGIASNPIGFTSQKIMDIAARCGVRPNKYNVLPEDGWKHCLKYVSQYVNNPHDIINFERDWLKTVEKQLNSKSTQMIKQHWDSYQHQYQGFLNNKEFWTSGPKIVLEFKHWHDLPKDQYLQRLEDIQTKTFWGELTLKEPILRHNPRFEKSFIEIWIMQGQKNDKQGNWLTNNIFRNLYIDCCGVCGYDAML